jgi:IPT/TIG domain
MNWDVLSSGTTVAPGSNPPLTLVGDWGLAVTQAPNGNMFDARYGQSSVFAYSLSGIFPRRGVLAGGTSVSIYRNKTFFRSPTVMVGDGECLNVDVVSSPLVKCRLPLGSLGPKDVKVTIDGVRHTLTKGY